MKAEAITALIKGLKSAGIDFVPTLPSSAFRPVKPHTCVTRILNMSRLAMRAMA